MYVARLLPAVALFAALSSATVFASDLQVGDVIVSTPEGLVAANKPGSTLHFAPDGNTIFDGPMEGYDGHYVAKADFSAVASQIGEANLCARRGITLYVPAIPYNALRTPTVLLRVRCGNTVKTFNDTVAPDLGAVATTLLSISSKLTWVRTGPAQRQSIARLLR